MVGDMSDETRSRRERPAKPALTRDGIVATAVELVRAEGLGRVTMRRLAQELDTGAASLYVYVRNTAALHAAVLDELLGAVDLGPVTAAGDWRERLEQVLKSYAGVLFEYPGLAQAALVARPAGEYYLDLLEGYSHCSQRAVYPRSRRPGVWTSCCTSRPRRLPSMHRPIRVRPPLRPTPGHWCGRCRRPRTGRSWRPMEMTC